MEHKPSDAATLISQQTHKPFQGILFMVVGIGALSMMDALAKALVQKEINPIQILGLRLFIVVPAILAYYAMVGKLRELVPVRKKFQLIRGCIGFLAPFCFFLSLKYLPLSDAVITSYCSIMIVTALSHFVLKEKVGVHRWGAVIVGFIGVYIAISPTGEGRILGYLLVLVAALSYAVLLVTGRMLSRTESVGSLVFVFNVCVGIIALCITPFIWQPIDLVIFTQIAGLSCLALIGHFCLVLAFSRSQASVIAPFEYTSIIWALLIEWTIWHYLPAQHTVIGGIVIICAGIYVIYRESLQNRAQKQSPEQ